jgi:hypothetical protein
MIGFDSNGAVGKGKLVPTKFKVQRDVARMGISPHLPKMSHPVRLPCDKWGPMMGKDVKLKARKFHRGWFECEWTF